MNVPYIMFRKLQRESFKFLKILSFVIVYTYRGRWRDNRQSIFLNFEYKSVFTDEVESSRTEYPY